MNEAIVTNHHLFRSWELPLSDDKQREIEDFMNECQKHNRSWDIQYHTGNVIIVAVETVVECEVEDDNPPPVPAEKAQNGTQQRTSQKT